MEQIKTVEIKDICLGIYEGPHATPKNSDTGGIYLGIPALDPKGFIDYSRAKRIAEEDLPLWTKRVTPQEDDIVFTNEATLNLYAIIPANFHGCLGRRLGLIRPNKDLVNVKYLFYYFFSPEWRETVAKNKVSGATVDRILMTKFPSFPVSLPSLKTQERIANILSVIDAKIEVNRQINDNLEQQAQALYKSWFVDFEPFKDGKFFDAELGIIPEGWKILPLSSLGSIICGKTPSKSNKDFYDGNIPFIKIPDMHNKIFVSNSEDHLSDLGMNSQRNKTIPPYSILVSCIATVGLVCINTKVCQTNQQINTLIPYEDNYRIYLFLFLKSLREQLITLGSGGTTTLNVNTSQFSNLKIIVPDTKSLKAFSSIAESLFQRINNNCDTNYMLSNLRDMILPKLMSGELKINDLDC